MPELAVNDRSAVFACVRACACSNKGERSLRIALEHAFDGAGLDFIQRVPLRFKAGVVDFLSRDGLAILVRTTGGLDDMFLELRTLVADDRVQSVLLITTRPVHRKLPGGMNQKPIEVFWIGGLS